MPEENPGHGKDYVNELIGHEANSEYIKGWIAGYTHTDDELYEELNNYYKNKGG